MAFIRAGTFIRINTIIVFIQKVNYAGIGASSEFQRYVRLTKELARVQIAEASREEKLAFFINIYNAQVIHANVTMGPPVNLWQRYKVCLNKFLFGFGIPF